MQLSRLKIASAVAVLGVAGVTAAAVAGDRSSLDADLDGLQEAPVVSTTGGGTFKSQINRAGTEISYTLRYRVEGAVQQAHIHLGQRDVNGGISVFLCSNLGNGPAGTQACPAAPATISGTITPADVVGPVDQGIGPMEFDELVRAIRAGVTYANVHSETFKGGEIRGQLND